MLKAIHNYIPMLVPMYNEPHRHYHDLTHIHNLTRMIDSKSYLSMIDHSKWDKSVFSFDTTEQLRFVAWFHDCYYDPYAGSPYNEKMSRDICYEMLKDDAWSDPLNSNSTQLNNILNGIMLTADHLKDLRTLDNTVSFADLMFMDLDMHGFIDESEFNYNNGTIRKEYYKSTQEEYLNGRINFLSKLLNKDKIYYVYREEFEEAARKNIKQGLQDAIDDLDAIS